MRRRLLLIALLSTLLSVPHVRSEVKGREAQGVYPKTTPRAVQWKSPSTSRYYPDRVIVKLRPMKLQIAKQSFGVRSLDLFAQRYGVKSIDAMFPHHAPPAPGKKIDLTRFYYMRYSQSVDPFSVAKELSARPEVEYAEPWFVYEVDKSPLFVPNDTFYLSQQWDLRIMKADSAWNVSQGDTSVFIAVVDNAIQWDHPDLAANIWNNPGEMGLDSQGHDKRFNGIDDDSDGYVDDWHGWDFAGADYNNPSQDNNTEPTGTNNTHGTHVAGIACAATNNQIGIAGVGFKCRILPVKVGADNDFSGTGGTAVILEGFPGIIYAADMGAIAINCSWGGAGYSQYEQDVVNYAAEKGSVVIAAAGNTGDTQISYPAGYDNVISVASTNPFDIKASYSSYGPTVDLCAPGGDTHANSQVLSTFYPNTYATEIGTSQAAPHVTGLAALVKTVYPSYYGLQVGEQIRVTCDDISAVNQGYLQQLGKGRINAYRALTGSSPSVRVTSFTIDDAAGGNGNGVPEPNETVNLITTLTNYLQPTTSAAAVTLVTNDTTVQILSGAWNFGTLGMSESVTSTATTFQIKVKGSVPPDHVVNLTYNYSDASYSDYQVISLTVNPSYATQSINNISVTFTRNGRIGFNDFPNNTQGVGFVYNGGNQMYEGGLILGYSSTRLVDVVRNDVFTQDDDFEAHGVFNLQTPGLLSDQDGATAFSDSQAPATNAIGLAVKMSTYAFAGSLDRDYVLLRYDIKNISGSNISDLYTGLFIDWDMLPVGLAPADYYNNNRTFYDSSRSLGYAWYDTTALTTYCGARALTGGGSYYGLTIDSANGSRAMKWGWLTSGIHLMTQRNDIDFVVGSGPYSILNGSTQTVGFALIGGVGLPAFQTHADAAFAKWRVIMSELSGRPLFEISIHQNPAFTRYADLYVVSDSQLVAPPIMTIQNTAPASIDTVVLTQEMDSTSVYKGGYQFTTAGAKSIQITARTVGGMDTIVNRSLQVVLAQTGIAQQIDAPDHRATAFIPSNALSEETCFLSYSSDDQLHTPAFYPRTYSFGPEKNFSSPLSVKFSYADIPQFSGKERYVHIFRHAGNGWVRLDSWINTKTKSVQATVSTLGEFALGLDETSASGSLPTEFTLFQNYPNPFNPDTRIRYVTPADGRVRLRIFNLLGQQVRLLIDGYQDAGLHEVVWNGKNEQSEPLASGLYVYRLEQLRGNTIISSTSQKMLMVK